MDDSSKKIKKNKQLDLFDSDRTFSTGGFAMKDESHKSKKNKETTIEGFTQKESRGEFFIPINGFVWLYPEETLIVNHPAFQRLGRIYQLGQTYLVYRGATHKRFEHVLGTLHVAHRMIASLKYNHARARARDKKIIIGTKLSLEEERFVRLGALLHDIGHIAAGHTIEDELGLIGKHDCDERISMVFENTNWVDQSEQTLKDLIDSTYKPYVPKDLLKEEVTASIIIRFLIRKPPKPAKDNFGSFLENVKNSDSLRLEVCRDMIGNTICADLLDYIYRDWYHIGKPKTVDERILQYMEIRPRDSKLKKNPSKPKQSDRFVISLGSRPKIRTDAISSILELLESRYQLAESVLFHRTKLSASAMLDRALYELWDGDGIDENFILPFGDEQLIAECKKKAEEKAQKKKLPKEKVAPYLLLDALEKRQLYKSLCTYRYDDLPSHIRTKVLNLYTGKDAEKKKLASHCRTNALRLLEKDFDLTSGSLAMYCPTEKMNSKIAEVSIAVNDEIETFDAYEKKRDNSLSGGHLDAQIKRFKRLCQRSFKIEPFSVVRIEPH